MGLEPTPGPWQGPVLPLYYGRPNQQNFNTPAFRRQEPRGNVVDEDLTHTAAPSGLPGQASFESPWESGISRLAIPARSSRRETSVAARQIWRPFPGRYTRAQTAPRPCKTQSPASACVSAADLSQAWCVFVRFSFWAWFEYLSGDSCAQVLIRSILCTQSDYTPLSYWL
jgi:hypothetical protein